MDISQLTELLGWATVVNIGFLFFSAILLIAFRANIMSVHNKMFGIAEKDISLIYFKYLAKYKMLVFVFLASPYIALKIMGQ